VSKQLIDSDWISNLRKFNKLLIGFSGGLDSTVLLHALASHPSLHDKLLAIHVNHGISLNSHQWQTHCEQFCLALGVNFLSQLVQFDRSANIEERARIARYTVFASVLHVNECLILAHHQDDQAETLLLQLFRGTGIDGLAGMTESSPFEKGTLLRPFLSYTRSQLEHYAMSHKLSWIEDESNQDMKYSRNYVRQQVMPLLLEKWPGVVGNLARTAAHCQQAKANLQDLAILDSQKLAPSLNYLSIMPLIGLSFERISNVLRVWLKKNHIQMPSTVTFQRLIHEVLFSRADAMSEVSWDKVQVRRYQNRLYLEPKKLFELPSSFEWTEFPKSLMLADQGFHLSAIKAISGFKLPHGAAIQVRFRQGGEKFMWHGQTKQLKKLVQEWKIPPWLRDRVPLLYIDGQLAVVVGYAISDVFYAEGDSWVVINTQVN